MVAMVLQPKSATSHTAMVSPSRMRTVASMSQPYVQRKEGEVHAQVGPGQGVLVKWISAHYYTYYVSVVPAVYESNFYGARNAYQPLNGYRDILEARDFGNCAHLNPLNCFQ